MILISLIDMTINEIENRNMLTGAPGALVKEPNIVK
jgi:hypothetical protein